MSSALSDEFPDESLLARLFATVLQPGITPNWFRVVNYSLYALFGCILYLMWLNDPRIQLHVYIFFALAVGLYVSVNWYMSEMLAASKLGVQRIAEEKAAKKAAADKAARKLLGAADSEDDSADAAKKPKNKGKAKGKAKGTKRTKQPLNAQLSGKR